MYHLCVPFHTPQFALPTTSVCFDHCSLCIELSAAMYIFIQYNKAVALQVMEKQGMVHGWMIRNFCCLCHAEKIFCWLLITCLQFAAFFPESTIYRGVNPSLFTLFPCPPSPPPPPPIITPSTQHKNPSTPPPLSKFEHLLYGALAKEGIIYSLS